VHLQNVIYHSPLLLQGINTRMPCIKISTAESRVVTHFRTLIIVVSALFSSYCSPRFLDASDVGYRFFYFLHIVILGDAKRYLINLRILSYLN